MNLLFHFAKNKNMNTGIKTRDYYPGDEWVFFKLYGGITICDKILFTHVLPLTKFLESEDTIDKWFFIRYSDPEFHLRIRLHTNDKNKFGEITQCFNSVISPLCKNHILNYYCIDTYRREIGRYGADEISLSEDIFCLESKLMLPFFNDLYSAQLSNKRWKAAFPFIDNFLNIMNFDLSQKIEIIGRLNEGFLKEFGFGEHNKKKLNSQFRKYRNTIEQVMGKSQQDDTLGLAVSTYIKAINREFPTLMRKKGNTTLNISAHLHMMMNRLFYSSNRNYELLIYNFLYRYYKSVIFTKNRQPITHS